MQKNHSHSGQTYEIIDGKAVVAGGGLLAWGSSVFAAVPTEITTAMSTMSADAIAVATAFLVATIGLTAFMFMRKGAR